MPKRRDALEERTSPSDIEKVIEYLKDKSATKKVACKMLNIAYNTSRLDKLIEQHLKKKEDDARRRADKLGKPATSEEIDYIITEYLAGESLAKISESIYRGTSFIHTILNNYAVPIRKPSPNYFCPSLIPDDAVQSEFKIGEKVYSVKYDTLATVRILVDKPGPFKSKVYGVYLHGDWMQYAYQPAFELASLQKLRDAGIKI